MNPSELSPPVDSAPRKILLVDDDRSSVGILAGILGPPHYALAEADSGARALEIYPEFKPDLVLLGVELPGIGGFETCRRLKQAYGDDCAPIIFIPAPDAADAATAEGLAAGGADYLRQPFQPGEVVARVRTQLRIRQLAEQQKTFLAQLSSAKAANNRFLGNAAHDLRNPLSSIRGLAEFLRDGTVGPLSAEQLDLVNMIHVASQSMLALVNDLLDVATIEAGELKISPELHSLAELIERAVYLARIDAAKKKIHITLAASPIPAAAIDAAKIQQVIGNLLSNAVKYSPPGSTVTVELHADARQCSFGVKDQGPGIPGKERDKLFTDFGRLSVKPTGGELSTGLGLAICRKIVEAHHGTITAENLSSGGCEFRVTLPLAS